MPSELFELYSVPAFDRRVPEIVCGSEVGSNKQIVVPNTVLLCKINPRINRAWVVGSVTNHQKIASTEWITFPPHPDVEPKFLANFLSQSKIRLYLAANASGVGGSLTRVKASTVEHLPLSLPSLAEQRRIVAEIEKQFSRLDEAVANLQRVKANLKRYKAAVLKAAVEGRLVETEASLAHREGRSYETGEQLLQRILQERPKQWTARGRYSEPPPAVCDGLPLLPEGWTWASIDQISDFVTKGTTPAAQKLFDDSGDVQFLKVYNLTFDGTLNHRHKPAFVSRETHIEELARSKVRPGDVLINIVGPPLGQVSVVPELLAEANINQAIARIRPIAPLGFQFIAMALMCDDVMRWAIRRGKTTAGQANLTLELIRGLPIPLPPLGEQIRVAAEVDRRLSILRGVEAEVDANLQRAQRLRQSTMAKAFAPNVLV
ncbi:MAG: restriction endonuclease subunit S [Hydrogenophaga sp.]|nr:restriction endonuclease subunit S [Hydrogenophaga sp.]MDP3808650.1 restriction endonuclease subunit S [Hydrogenophaga sp.]MDP3927124.1 restriction endonuclease subunit S [Hydrogenophaga sp.]